jgi:uncharacterized protein YjbJ (UPF0337 family)
VEAHRFVPPRAKSGQKITTLGAALVFGGLAAFRRTVSLYALKFAYFALNGRDRLGIELALPYQRGKKEIHMKDSIKDKVEGAAHDVKGNIKEKIGRATNDPDLEDKGTAEKIGGKVQKKVGDVEMRREAVLRTALPRPVRKLGPSGG